MGTKRYYVTAIINLDDKYDFESMSHFSSHSEVRDSEDNAYSIVAESMPNCEAVCALTKIGDGDNVQPIKYDITPLGRHILSIKNYYKTLKERWGIKGMGR